MATSAEKRRFLVELIKPSHYDDDGYVIQWWRAFIPSNSLSSVYALTLEASRHMVLGDDTEWFVVRKQPKGRGTDQLVRRTNSSQRFHRSQRLLELFVLPKCLTQLSLYQTWTDAIGPYLF